MIDDAHLTHGLAGDELPPDWPALTEREVAQLLSRVPKLGATGAIRWRSPRPLSAAALVETASGRVFVKRHHASVRSAATLAEEHAFASHLRAHGIPLPPLFTDVTGHTAMAMGEWVYEIQAPAQGNDIYRDAFSWSPVGGLRHARAAGSMLARLHQAAEGYVAPQRATHILVARADILGARDPVAAVEAELAERPALAAYLGDRDWRAELSATMAPWQGAAHAGVRRQPRLWTHGDWHVSNLCWSDASDAATIIDVLDLGLSAATFALFDLATAIERNAIAWLEIAQGEIGHADLALALLEGYHAVKPLSDDDLDVLASVLPVVHVDFALSEVEYFEGMTRRRDHADVAWHTFLHGHAAWFATPPGQRLLDAIRHAGARFVLQ
ncbi:phosphotransferase [Luteibacter aegosomaticola]|uniref:phosphotransferase enzyme family protein n=1 Tax=Luteibacter aegosomaticola TaxID=2911538 RepID=UPI001FFB4BD9|nr:phosphotransferase [Luteibacter aegosomaticola]UPG90737.1 phosphotransferase [Luteibacter aegosomaticola]